MNLGLRFRDQLLSIGAWLEEELDQLVAAINISWSQEHKEDGSHSAVTADSVTTPLATVERLEVENAVIENAEIQDLLVIGDGSGGELHLTKDTVSSDNNSTLDLKATQFGSTVRIYAGDVLVATFSISNSQANLVIPTVDGIGGSAGPMLEIGRNSDATVPAAGTVKLTTRSGTNYYLWVDATGNVRVHTSAPTNSASDTAGQIVGSTGWATWSPTLSGITIGNGSVIARYTKVNKTVFYVLIIVIGSTTVFPGPLSFSMPSTMQALAAAMETGHGLILDASASAYFRAAAGVNTATTSAIYGGGSALTALSGVFPITFATSDQIGITGHYEEA